MKILIINWRDITHPWSGGSEKYIHEIAREWIRLGHTVHLLCGGYSGARSTEIIDGIIIHRLGSTYSIYILAPVYYLFKLRDKKFDVLIEVAYGVTFMSRLFSRLPKVLIIHHDHTLPWQTEWPYIISRIGIWLEHKLVPYFYQNIPVVTLSTKTRQLLSAQGFKKIYTVPPGNYNSKLTPKKTKYPTILYLGRLRRYKRVALLLEVFGKLSTKMPQLRLIIAGAGQEASPIADLTRYLHLEQKVELKGYVSEKEKKRLLTTAWVMAFPSQIEGWGLVALEAAACGLPTVGFNVPGVSESIRNDKSGFVVKTTKEFEGALLKILTNDQLQKQLSDGAKRWAAEFSWEKSAKSFLSVIHKTNTVLKNQYDERYFASFWRKSDRRTFHPTYNIRVNYITEHLNPKTTLDVGCGTGLLVRLLRDHGVNAYGVDVSAAALDLVPSKTRAFVGQGNILKLASANNAYDTVTCIDVLEHIPYTDLPRAILECARVARSSLYFDITCLEDLFFIFSDRTHITKLFSWQWQRMIQITLGNQWRLKRAYVLPFIHHAIFEAKRV